MATMSDLESTEPVRESEIAAWDIETDVAVVGMGCAGAAAAIEAADQGARVLVLERASGGGGTSANSGGLIYLGGGTPVQRACGFEDTPEDMFKFLMEACGPRPEEAKVRAFADGSVDLYDWLVSKGVPFKHTYYPEPGMEPPTDDCLIYSGGEDAFPFNEIAAPSPRAHKPQTPGAAGGFLMQKLVEAVESTDTRVECDARSRRLVVDDSGRVVGVVFTQDQQTKYARAAGGVVLAAGGFINNKQMVRSYAPLLAKCKFQLGVDGDDGSGIRMGLGAGGNAVRMDAGCVALPLYPPKSLMAGILVNRHGQRYINEDTYFGHAGRASLYEQGGRAFLIVDSDMYVVNHAGMQATAVEETIEELEATLEIPTGALQSTVNYYNEHASRGEDPQFRKTTKLVKPLVKPPFGAIDCSTDNSIYAVFTLGGLQTTVEGQVMGRDGGVVAGLYAVGRTSSGVSAFGYCSGISLADGMFFGRKAGRHAATAGVS